MEVLCERTHWTFKQSWVESVKQSTLRMSVCLESRAGWSKCRNHSRRHTHWLYLGRMAAEEKLGGGMCLLANTAALLMLPTAPDQRRLTAEPPAHREACCRNSVLSAHRQVHRETPEEAELSVFSAAAV